jgi:hypothetical protein
MPPSGHSTAFMSRGTADPNLIEFAHVSPPVRRCRAASGLEGSWRLDHHEFAGAFPSSSPVNVPRQPTGQNGDGPEAGSVPVAARFLKLPRWAGEGSHSKQPRRVRLYSRGYWCKKKPPECEQHHRLLVIIESIFRAVLFERYGDEQAGGKRCTRTVGARWRSSNLENTRCRRSGLAYRPYRRSGSATRHRGCGGDDPPRRPTFEAGGRYRSEQADSSPKHTRFVRRT